MRHSLFARVNESSVCVFPRVRGQFTSARCRMWVWMFSYWLTVFIPHHLFHKVHVFFLARVKSATACLSCVTCFFIVRMHKTTFEGWSDNVSGRIQSMSLVLLYNRRFILRSLYREKEAGRVFQEIRAFLYLLQDYCQKSDKNTAFWFCQTFRRKWKANFKLYPHMVFTYYISGILLRKCLVLSFRRRSHTVHRFVKVWDGSLLRTNLKRYPPWSGTRGLIMYYGEYYPRMVVVFWRHEWDASKPPNTHFRLSSGRPRPRSRSVSPFDTHLTQPTWKTQRWRHMKSFQSSQELHTYSILAINCLDMCQKYVFRDKYKGSISEGSFLAVSF